MKEEFKIEKNIKIPKGNSIYPFSEMEVGDSFFTNKHIQSSCYAYGKRNGKKFTIHREGNGFRIWRIK